MLELDLEFDEMPKIAPLCVFSRPPEAQASALEFRCTVVTPMLGGGAELRTAHGSSSGFRVRPSAVRGHLRFWWRATAGARLTGDASDLWRREAALWGAAATAGRVRLEVLVNDPGRNLTQSERNQLPAPTPIYPIGQADRARVIVGIDFTVKLTVSGATGQTEEQIRADYKDLRRAAFAWTLFGGVGCRTRRGMGALLCQDFIHPNYALSFPPANGEQATPRFTLPVWDELTSAERRGWAQLGGSGWGSRPLLARIRAGTSPLAAMNELIDDLRSYRLAGGYSEFASHDHTYHWPHPIRRWPSGLLLRPVLVGEEWHKMAVPLYLDTTVRDASGRDYLDGMNHALDHFWDQRGYR
ncbi:MAG: type III-B CRISPR module RAMP protein Cmr1 [Acidobacteriaceae bacterium]|nr:type III-B CRISPR module RAMP protein Cmr1 [Acidobacteriaceae bacterium]